jgi:ATP-binding cassette subfamily F protein 3
VFVSHDRYFIDKLATRIFEIEEGRFRDYSGNYEDYVWQKEHGARHALAAEAASTEEATEVAPARGDGEGQASKSEKHRKRLNPIRVREMTTRRGELEEAIARCEAEIAGHELELSNFKNAEESIRLVKQVDQSRVQLAEMIEEWEQISQTLEEAGESVRS